MTSHDLDEVEKLCERLMVIDHGQVSLDGTLSELRAGQQPELSIKLVRESVGTIHEPLLQELAALPFVARLELNGNVLTAMLNKGEEELISQVITRLARAGVGIAEVELCQRSLEEIYLQAIENHKGNANKENSNESDAGLIS
jgi:ABC-2 type transport system ATP-binding protein